MILTFAKLQRLSGLDKPRPDTIRKWLTRTGVKYLPDAKGRPYTTLDALNRKLQRMTDDGFTLADPEGGLPEKRAVVSRRPKQVGRADQGGRGADGAAALPAGMLIEYDGTQDGLRSANALLAASRDSHYNKARI